MFLNFRTSTVWKNLNPFWGEDYTVYLPNGFHELALYVFDEDKLNRCALDVCDVTRGIFSQILFVTDTCSSNHSMDGCVLLIVSICLYRISIITHRCTWTVSKMLRCHFTEMTSWAKWRSPNQKLRSQSEVQIQLYIYQTCILIIRASIHVHWYVHVHVIDGVHTNLIVYFNRLHVSFSQNDMELIT